MFKKKNMIIGIVILIVIAGLVLAAVQANVADVRLEAVQKGDMQEDVELRGKVELRDKRKVYSKLAGIIDVIKGEEGHEVKAESSLLQMDIEDMDIALDRAYASYDAAQASLQELKTSIKPEQIQQAQVRLDQAKIGEEAAQKDFDYKKGQLDKNRALYENGAIPEQSLKDTERLFETAESTLQNARQTVKAAQSSLELLRKGVSESAVKAAEANVKQAGLQLEELRNNIGKANVYAGMKGTVLTKYAEEGMAVQPGTLLFEIGNYDTAYIRVDVLVDDAANIDIGQKAILSGDVIKDNRIEGEVYYIAPKAESQISSLGVEQQRIEMRIKYDNTKANLKPGYGIDVDIITKENPAALFVPDKAVFKLDGQESVFVVNDDGKLVLRAVKTGMENEDDVEILEGLTEGDQVVGDPENNLEPGMKVK